MAAFTVVLAHTIAIGSRHGLLPADWDGLRSYGFYLGVFGVDVFFMISGFLILQTLVRNANPRRFLINRCWRIYPAYVPLVLLVFIAGPLLHYPGVDGLQHRPFAYLGLLGQNLVFWAPVMKHAWSLAYESVFYVLVCALYTAWRGREARRAVGGVWFVALLYVAARCLVSYPHALFFVAGAAVYSLGQRSTLPARPRPWLREAGGVLLVLQYVALRHVLLPAVGFGFVAFITCVQEWGWLAAGLRRRAMQWLGTISYSLYLVHPLVLDAVGRVLRSARGLLPSSWSGAWMVLFVVLGAASAVGLSALYWRLCEVALTQRLQQRLTGRRGDAAPSRPAARAELPEGTPT